MATAADISRANTADTGDAAPAAIQALASLGAGGTQLQNQERDLHRWVRSLYDLQLETYDAPMTLQALRLKSGSKF